MTTEGAAALFQLPLAYEYGATLLWAVSGSLIGIRKGYDVIGVFILALVSSLGGGMIRDGVLLHQGLPLVLKHPAFLMIVAAGVALTWIFGTRIVRVRFFDKITFLIDSVGLGAFAAVGMDRAFAAGCSVPGVVLVGVINAVGGQIIRDILISKEPDILKPGELMATAVLAGAAVFIGLSLILGTNHSLAAWLAIATVFAIRLASQTLGLRTSAHREFLGK